MAWQPCLPSHQKDEGTGPDLLSGRTKTDTLPTAVTEVTGSMDTVSDGEKSRPKACPLIKRERALHNFFLLMIGGSS